MTQTDHSIVTLTPLSPAQMDKVIALVAQPSIHGIMYTLPKPFSGEAAAAWLADSTKRHFGMYRPGGDVLLGCISLIDIDREQKTAEISGFVSETARGAGLANNALAALLDSVRHQTEVREVYAHHLRSNAATGALLRRQGFKLLRERPVPTEHGEPKQYLRLMNLQLVTTTD